MKRDGSLKKINKMDKPLAKHTKKKRQKTQIKSVMKEILCLIPQKYKGSLGTTMRNCKSTSWTMC